MANYSYMTACSSDIFPDIRLHEEEDWTPYPARNESGPWYEAKYGIPLFWLCLFTPEHIRAVSLPMGDEDEPDPAGYTVPALFAPQAEAAKNLRCRRPLLEVLLRSPELALYDDFTVKVERGYGPFLLVITEEVAMMSEEGEFAASIEKALRVMQALPPEEWTGNFDFTNVTGLSRNDLMGDPRWYSLIGYDNVSHWPDEPRDAERVRHDAAEAAIRPQVIAMHEETTEGDASAQTAKWAQDESAAAPEALSAGMEQKAAREVRLLQAVREASRLADKPLYVDNRNVQHPSPPGTRLILPLLALAPLVAAGWFFSWWWMLALPVTFLLAVKLFACVISDFMIDMESGTIRWRGTKRPFENVVPLEFRIVSSEKKETLLYCPPDNKPAVLGVFTGPEAAGAAMRLRGALLDLTRPSPGQ